MGDVKHLNQQDAIEKMREIAEAANICIFVTNINQAPLSAVPMATQKVDDEGNVWFMSGGDSNHNANIKQDDRVQLFYSNTGKYEYLNIFGYAAIVKDRNLIEEMWTPMAKTWFDGKDDPNLTLIKVSPEEAYYWDTKDSKMVSLAKFVIGSMGIKTDDGGVEGELNVR